MKYLLLTLILLLMMTAHTQATQTIYSDGYGECWKTLEAAQKYPKKPKSSKIRGHLGCEKYTVLSSGADTCGRCKWVNSYTGEREHKCKGYVIAECK